MIVAGATTPHEACVRLAAKVRLSLAGRLTDVIVAARPNHNPPRIALVWAGNRLVRRELCVALHPDEAAPIVIAIVQEADAEAALKDLRDKIMTVSAEPYLYDRARSPRIPESVIAQAEALYLQGADQRSLSRRFNVSQSQLSRRFQQRRAARAAKALP